MESGGPSGGVEKKEESRHCRESDWVNKVCVWGGKQSGHLRLLGIHPSWLPKG